MQEDLKFSVITVSFNQGAFIKDTIESVLAHELAHLRRYDHIVNLVQRVIESFLFFHPAIWWISRKIRDEREHCCDDLVIACGAVPLDYARSLLRVAELSRVNSRTARRQSQGSFTAVSLLATGDRPSTLRQRIARMLGGDNEMDVRPASPWFLGSIATVSLLAVWLLMTMTWTVLAEINRDRTQKTVIVTWSAIVDDSVMNEIRGINGLSVVASGAMEAPGDAKYSTLNCSADELRSILKTHADNKRLIAWQAGTRLSMPTGGWRVRGENRFFQENNIGDLETGDQFNPRFSVSWHADGNEIREEDSERARLSVTGKYNFPQTGLVPVSMPGDSGTSHADAKLQMSTIPARANVKFSSEMTDGDATVVVLSPPAVIREYRVLVKDENGSHFEEKTKLGPKLHAIFVHEAVRVPVKHLDQFNKLTRVEDWIRRGPDETKEQLTRVAEWQSRPARSVSAADARWTRDLPNGGHVQLVGLGRPNEARMIWWTPEGEPLGQVSDNLGQSLTEMELVAIVRVWEDGVSRKLPPPKGMVFAGGVMDLPDTFPSSGTQLLVLPALVDKATGKVSLKVGAGFGAWSPEVKIATAEGSTATSNGIEIKTQHSHESEAFGPAGPPTFIKTTGTWFHFQPKSDFEFTAIAVARDGRKHSSVNDPVVVENGNRPNAQYFTQHLPKADIQHFLIKSRPVHWTEFTDFATEPAVALVPPLEFEGKNQSPHLGKYSVKLPDGTAVELLGVGDLETPKAHWWKADGQQLESAPVDGLAVGVGGTPEMRSRMRNFVYRVSGLSKGQEVKLYSTEIPGHAPWERLHAGNKRDDGLVANLFVPFSRLQPTVVCIDVTRREWWSPMSITPSLQVRQPDEADPLTKKLYGLIRVIGVSEETGMPPAIAEEIVRGLTYPPQATLTVEWDLSLTRDLAQIEMFAVEKSGTKHQVRAWGKQRRTKDKTIEQPHFSCRLVDVDHFEIRLRPILHHIKFENVSLHPNKKTDVKVLVASQPAQKPQHYIASFSDGRSVELVGITKNTAPANEGWKPDGTLVGDVGYWPSTIVLHGKNSMNYSTSTYVENGAHPEPDAEAIDLLVRFRGLKEQPSLAFDLATNGSSYHHLPLKEPYELRISTRRRGEPSPGAKWSIPDGEMRIGLTDEPWGKWLQISPEGKVLNPLADADLYRSSYEQVHIERVEPHERAPNKQALVLRQPQNTSSLYAFEIRGIDEDGKPQWVLEWEGRGVEGTELQEGRWGLASSETKPLARYEFRLRPYRHWVTFNGVSFEPGKQSEVTVSTRSLPDPDSERIQHIDSSQPQVVVGERQEHVVWLHDSKRACSAGDFSTLKYWWQNQSQWQPIALKVEHHANSIAASLILPLIVIGTNVGTAEVWDVTSQKRLSELRSSPEYSVYAVAISSDDKLVAACGTDGTVAVFDRESQQLIARFGERADTRMSSLAFSPDGKTLAAMDRYGHLVLWRLVEQTKLAEWKGIAGGEDCSVQWAPDGQRLAVSGPGRVTLVSPEKGSQPQVIMAPEEVISRFPKGDDSKVSGPEPGGIKFASVTALSPDVRTAASVVPDGSVGIWDLATRKVIQKLPAPPESVIVRDSVGKGLRNLVFAPDGRRLACTTIRGDVIFWQVSQAIEFKRRDGLGSVARPSYSELSLDVGFGPFRLKGFPIAGDSTRPVAYLDSLVSQLPENVRLNADKRFNDGQRAIYGTSAQMPSEETMDRIIDDSRDLPPIYRAALMCNLWIFANDWVSNDSTRRLYGSDILFFERIKNKCAIAALEQAEEIPVGLTLRFLEKSTGALSSLGTDNDPKFSAQRQSRAKLWLTLIEKVRAVVDPDWDANDQPMLNPDVSPLDAGGNPQQRADDTARIEDHRHKAERYYQQLQVRRLLAELLPRMEEDLIRLYVCKPFNPGQLESLLDQHTSDKAQRDRIAKSVRLVNAILPNGTRLKFGWPDALAEAGPVGVSALMAAVTDKTYPHFIRNDGAWALGLIGDPRAIDALAAVAEDEATPAKYKDIAQEFVRSLKKKTADQGNQTTKRDFVVGTVVTPDGKPVAGIEILAFQGGKQLEQKFVTDEKGEFRVPQAWREVDHWLTVVARDGRERLGWFDFMIHGHSINGQNPKDGSFRMVLLPMSRTIRGRVLDESGLPLPQVSVRITQLGHEVNSESVHWKYQKLGEETLVRGAITDNDGRFELKLPVDSVAWLGTSHPDWVEQRICVTKDKGDVVDTILVRAAKVAGRVIDSRTGTPLVGVTISAHATKTDILESGGDEAKTDADGNYLIQGLRSGEYTIQLERGVDKVLTALAFTKVMLKPNETFSANFSLSAGKRLTGRVLNIDTGEPIPNCKVKCSNPARPNVGDSTETGENGEFQFFVPPGRSSLDATEGRRFGNDSTREVDVPADGDPEPVILKVGEAIESVPGSFKILLGPPLDRKVSLHFQRTPLVEVLTKACEAAAVNLELDDDGLKGVGYTKNMAVTIDSDNVTLRDALTQVLKPFDKLSFTLDKNQLFVSNREQVETRERQVAEPKPPTDEKKADVTSPPKGLEFLKPYPKLYGLSLDMTEPQFLEIVKQQELKTKEIGEEKYPCYELPLDEGHTLIVMFDKNAKCSGIQRVRGGDAKQHAVEVRLVGGPKSEPLPKVKVEFTSGHGSDQKSFGTFTTDDDGWVKTTLPIGFYYLRLSSEKEWPYLTFEKFWTGERQAVSRSLNVRVTESEVEKWLDGKRRENGFEAATKERPARITFTLEPAVELVLRAIDIETGKGIRGAEFYEEIAAGEDWAHPIYGDNLGTKFTYDSKATTGPENLTDKEGYSRRWVGEKAEESKFGVWKAPAGYELVEPKAEIAVLAKLGQTRAEQIFKFRRIRWAVRVEPEKKKVLLGEPLTLTFVVKNATNETRGLELGGDYRNKLGRPESFQVTVINNEAKQMPVPEVGSSKGGVSYNVLLKPDGEATVQLKLSDWATITQPGNYRVILRRQLKLFPIKAQVRDHIEWGDKPEVVDIKARCEFDVVIPNAAMRGAAGEQQIVGYQAAKGDNKNTTNPGRPPELRVMTKPTVLLPDHWIVQAVGFERDRSELVTASNQSFITIRRWDLAGMKLLSEIKLQGDKHGRAALPITLKFSGDRRRVIAATDAYVGIWDAGTGKLLKQLPFEAKDGIYDCAIDQLDCTPDLSVIVGHRALPGRLTLSYDAHVIVWDGATGNVLRTVIDKGATDLKALDLSTDGKRLVTTNGNGAKIWDTSTGQLFRSIPNDNSGRKHSEPDVSAQYSNHVWSVQFSPDGQQLAMGDILGVKLLDATSGKLLQQLEGPYRYSSNASPGLVFSQDGERLARLGTQEKIDGDKHRYVVPIWSTHTGARQFELHTEANDAAFSDDGQCLAVVFSDMQQALSVWRLDDDAADDIKTAGPGPHSRVDRVEENGHYVGAKAAQYIEQFKPAWGEAKLGLQYGIALTKPQQPFRKGDRVPLVVFFRNASEMPIKFDTAPDFFGNEPKVLNVNGEQLTLETSRSWAASRTITRSSNPAKHSVRST